VVFIEGAEGGGSGTGEGPVKMEHFQGAFERGREGSWWSLVILIVTFSSASFIPCFSGCLRLPAILRLGLFLAFFVFLVGN